MRIHQNHLLHSASDLANFLDCEQQTDLLVRQGTIEYPHFARFFLNSIEMPAIQPAQQISTGGSLCPNRL